jgi:hypothetical protein
MQNPPVHYSSHPEDFCSAAVGAARKVNNQ